MNKKIVLIGLILIAILIFGCNVPEKVIIKGTPDLSFSTDINLGDVLNISSENIAGSNTVLECNHGSLVVKTFVIHKFIEDDIFQIENPSGPDGNTNLAIQVDGKTAYVNNTHNDYIVFNSEHILSDFDPDNREIVSFSDFGNIDELKGFDFSSENIKTYLYISGTNIVEELEMDIEIDGELIPKIKNHIPVSSGVDLSQNYYNSSALPGGGQLLEIDIANYINNDIDMEIDYKIVIPQDAEIMRDWLAEGAVDNRGHDVVIELVIWFPLEMIAAGDITVKGIQGQGAELLFPIDYFDGVNDFLESIFDISNNLTMEIELFDEHPFNDAYMVVNNYPMDPILNKLAGKKIPFNFNEKQIDQINDLGFDPKFTIFFANGSNFNVPKDFELRIISIKFETTLFIEL